MDDNSDSRTAKSWSEQEEELGAFGLSTLATAYGVKAGALKARISSAQIRTISGAGLPRSVFLLRL